MKFAQSLAPLAVLALTASPALATTSPAPAPARSASIPFANINGVRNWVAQGNQTIYFQNNGRRWYRAVLFAPSTDLPFATRIGIDSRPLGTLDKWGAVIVHGQRYPFQSFEQVDGPPAKASGKKG
ncbi:DUF6491 family protein [Sphingobium lignivorans]|uniref:Uncharacterized protein n=1 Tax=Sphingobium lignivorans TaxID=2735886 RepID=A0ABR6NEQ1_9SPHN|nr:DUF6491 family protein [Sphingobium lignivorans]MBB5985132.1 hypothetical protein [Sphingobium lignivorans]